MTDRFPTLWAVLLLAIHLPLGILMNAEPALATGHAWGCLAVGLACALGAKRPAWTAYSAAYITGVEVLWRATDAAALWEFGKYSTIVILLASLLRRAAGIHGPSTLYLALLAPSVLLTTTTLGIDLTLGELSANLSGPLSLAVCIWFFTRTCLSGNERQRLLIWAIAPAIATASLALYGALSDTAITFTYESNKSTSAGFGPNQVSATLGFGALACFLLLQRHRQAPLVRWLLLASMLFLGAQAALTFSRGGVYAATGAAMAATFYLLRDPHFRRRAVGMVCVIWLLAAYQIAPRLNGFTGGFLEARFQDKSLTSREEVALGDLLLWLDHPVAGVGPGLSPLLRPMANLTAPHTEFTRMLAEHGAFGLIALSVLWAIARRALRRASTTEQKSWAAAMLGWSVLFMLVNAMRLVAPSFAFGLACSPPRPARIECA